MDYGKLAEVIKEAVRAGVKKHGAHLRLATVASVSGSTTDVRLDGSAGTAKIVRACPCAAGDRVVVLKEGTQFYAIARIGG